MVRPDIRVVRVSRVRAKEQDSFDNCRISSLDASRKPQR